MNPPARIMTAKGLAPAGSPDPAAAGMDGAWGLSKAVLRELAGSRKSQARFLLRALWQRSLLRRYAAAAPSSSLGAYLRQRPELCGTLIWPYQCAAWTAAERFARIESHFAVLDTAPPQLRFPTTDSLVLADLSDLSAGARLVLDQPKWLYREGLLALNIFLGEHRAYSLSFSLHRAGGQTQLFVGGLQGRRCSEALDHYRHLTQDFHGLRPRDLLIDMLKAFAPAVGATRLLAVADGHRYFRHPYFGCAPHPEMLTDYDEIWSERGGVRVAPTHFELPLAPSIRRLEEIPSKKRALYRRRNEMLEVLFARVLDSASLSTGRH